MFSKRTRKVMDEKLEMRKVLLTTNKDWKAVVRYPGVLLVKKPGDRFFSPMDD